MYVCGDCIDAYGLTFDRAMSCVAACEICGALRGDWELERVVWTTDLRRFESVQAQLEQLRAAQMRQT